MAHRAKHRRANWVPERIKKAKARKRKETKRRAKDALRKQQAEEI